MAIIQQAAQTGSVFSKMLFYLVIVFIILNIIVIALEKKSFSESIYKVGETFFLSTKGLSESSKQILDNQGVIDTSGSSFKAVFSILKAYSSLFLSILGIIFWLKVIMFFISYSPIGDETNLFRNIFLSMIFFYVLQVIFIISEAGMTNKINGFIGEGSITSYIAMPIMSIWYFIQAVPYLIKPIKPLIEPTINLAQALP